MLSNSIDPFWISSTLVSKKKNNIEVGSATGFFYSNLDQKFLVTNRHVVRDEINRIYPDNLAIRVHSNRTDTRQNDDLEIPLYDDGKELWLEHPQLGKNADLVALRLNDVLKSNHMITGISSGNFLPNEILLSVGEGTMILGFPLGFHDDINNLPVLRSGMIASPYPTPFRGNPFFLIDARLHEGISGSPVFSKPKNIFRKKDGNIVLTGDTYYFLGVISSAFPPNSGDNPLGLNVVWYAYLIQEIVSQ